MLNFDNGILIILQNILDWLFKLTLYTSLLLTAIASK